MSDIKEFLQIIFSWPVAVIVATLVLRNPLSKLIDRLISSDSGNLKVGPIEVELGRLAKEGQQAVNQLSRINYLMAESRLLELEITEGNFGPVFTPEQRNRMRSQIDELKSLTSKDS